MTKRALRAKETQEYLHLYEALEPSSARNRLGELLAQARSASFRPADVRAVQDLGNITALKMPEFHKPAVAAEFTTAGPLQLYNAWLQALTQAWKQP